MIGPLITGIDGISLTSEEKEILKHPLIAGVILFTRNFEENQQLIALCKEIKACNAQLSISVDHEGGRVQRFKTGFTAIPSMFEAAKIEEQSEVLPHIAWTLAAELLARNIDFSYTPCVDLKGISEVIKERAFSSDPHAVAVAAEHFITGLHAATFPSIIKHFPGHGSVGPDSHIAMPVDTRSWNEIEQDLHPFKMLIKKGLADAVMPAHVIYSEVDSLPACFSPVWLQSILREKLAFNGVIISDDMGMQGAVQIGDYPTRVKAALDAGCDAAGIQVAASADAAGCRCCRSWQCCVR